MTIKIYTKVGDQGLTKQVTGKMVPKDNKQITVLGDIDELQSYLGVVIANLSQNCAELKDELVELQRNLYLLEADIVVRRRNEIDDDQVSKLEKRIDELNIKIPKISEFILPGGLITGANLQYARAVARRAERSLVSLSRSDEQDVSASNLKYLNRLSDYLFTLARYANVLDDYQDIKSKKKKPRTAKHR